jgi:hypothetical protein
VSAWWRSARVLYAYFRGAEYPMGRAEAAVVAVRMGRTWP